MRPDPKPTEVSGKTAGLCLSFLDLVAGISASRFLQPRQLHSALHCRRPPHSPFPAQICIEFQVGRWLFKLSYSTALGNALAIDFQGQRFTAYSSNLPHSVLVDNSPITVNEETRAATLLARYQWTSEADWSVILQIFRLS